jgi:hypothetical protein
MYFHDEVMDFKAFLQFMRFFQYYVDRYELERQFAKSYEGGLSN